MESTPVSTTPGSMVKHGGGIANAKANPVLRSQPGEDGEDLLLCKESKDTEFDLGTGIFVR
jgi:hypothetical protein